MHWISLSKIFLSQCHSDSYFFFFNDRYFEKAKSIKVPFTQVFTPDSDSSQIGKISKPQVESHIYCQENAKL